MSFGKISSALLLVGLVGCSTPAPTARLRIAGGEKITVVVGQPTENKDAKIITAMLVPDPKAKECAYVFIAELKNSVPPLNVKVEDVTDDKVILVAEDAEPKVTGKVWQSKGPKLSGGDETLLWTHEIDDGFRVYRFTFTLSDGSQSILNAATYYAGFMKASIREQLGVK